MTQQIHKEHSNGPVNIQNEGVLLLRGDGFHLESVIKEWRGWEGGLGEFLDDGDTLVRISFAFDFMADSHDQSVLLPHGGDKFLGAPAVIERCGKLLGCTIQSTAKAFTLPEFKKTTSIQC